MGLTVSAVWKNMRAEDYEAQPFLYNGGPDWGEWVTEIWRDKGLPARFYFRRLSPLLTCCAADSGDEEIKWVKPKEMIRAAERLKRRLRNDPDTKFIKSILQLYSRHSPGTESPQAELAASLDAVIEVARFVESVGGRHMSFRMEW